MREIELQLKEDTLGRSMVSCGLGGLGCRARFRVCKLGSASTIALILSCGDPNSTRDKARIAWVLLQSSFGGSSVSIF